MDQVHLSQPLIINHLHYPLRRQRQMCIIERINENCSRNFDFIADQKGMFSFTGLTENEVAQLKEKFSIYIVKSGRINVAGITSGNVKYIAKAITGVI